MSALEAAEEILAKLSPAEKAQLLRWTASDLSDAFPGIESRAIFVEEPSCRHDFLCFHSEFKCGITIYEARQHVQIP
jgi:hypothetical protein